MTEPTSPTAATTELGSRDCDRRGLLKRLGTAVGVGIAGAVAIPTLTREVAQAADEGPFLLGTANSPNNETTLEAGISLDTLHVTGGGNGVIGVTLANSGGAGLRGLAAHTGSVGVSGENDLGDGVRGQGATGVHGVGSSTGGFFTSTGDDGVFGQAAKNGVHGFVSTVDGVGVRGVAGAAGGVGVWGENSAGGLGVYGQSSEIAIYGYTGSSSGHAALHGFAAAAGGLGVFGYSPTTAIEGQTTGTAGDAGVFGLASNAGGRGVVGTSPSDGVYGATSSTGSGAGVHGVATANGGLGVSGTATTGTAVKGAASSAGGTGVAASAPAGATALQVNGVAKFSRSGLATVAKGTSSVTVHNVALAASSMALATLQHAAQGNAVSSAMPGVGASTLTIKLLKPATVAMKVAWFVLN